mmetsp:Transcript_883/g.706  ORF Transcript_883/g.706 Transcript_883/m.706 type:complete len:96 (+) Transcript_883:70-357(+)
MARLTTPSSLHKELLELLQRRCNDQANMSSLRGLSSSDRRNRCSCCDRSPCVMCMNLLSLRHASNPARITKRQPRARLENTMPSTQVTMTTTTNF